MAGGIKSRTLHACLMGVPFPCPVAGTDGITHEIQRLIASVQGQGCRVKRIVRNLYIYT